MFQTVKSIENNYSTSLLVDVVTKAVSAAPARYSSSALASSGMASLGDVIGALVVLKLMSAFLKDLYDKVNRCTLCNYSIAVGAASCIAAGICAGDAHLSPCRLTVPSHRALSPCPLTFVTGLGWILSAARCSRNSHGTFCLKI